MPRSTKKRSPRRGARPRVSRAAATGPAPARILNCVPSRDTERDWRFDDALASGMVAAVPIPKSKDLREDWWTIGDQGSTGSCVGWAMTDSVLRWHFVKTGRLDTDELLSPRFTWMAAKEFDEFTRRPTTFFETDGTSLKAALDISRKYGSVLDEVLPFASGKLFQGNTASFYARAAQRKIASYINLDQDLETWRHRLATEGPILTRLDCDDTWMNAKQQTGGRLETYDPMSARGSPSGIRSRRVYRSEQLGHRSLGRRGLRVRIEFLHRCCLHRSLRSVHGLRAARSRPS